MPRSSALINLLILGTSLSSAISASSLVPQGAFAFSRNDDFERRPQNECVDSSSGLTGDDSINDCVYSIDSSNGLALSRNSLQTASSKTVAYRSLAIDIPKFDVNVPVAMWYKYDKPLNDASGDDCDEDEWLKKNPIMDYPKLSENVSSIVGGTDTATYSHKISMKKIGTSLAGLDIIPEFFSKKFKLLPSLNDNQVCDGKNARIPKDGPIVLLAHGFLGSRFDLSHIAESLAQQGFICFSPEYPESLSSSYEAKDGLDRNVITNRLLEVITSELRIKSSSLGIVGHSLGCGTAMSTGDKSWTRVCIAGPPRRRDGIEIDGPILAITSVNDGAVSMSRIKDMIPSDFVKLEPKDIFIYEKESIPKRSVLIFDSEDAPNHISFLSENANDAMINFLSPLLPLAKALNIPVLDFDKYQISRDSKITASITIPLISFFLKQNML